MSDPLHLLIIASAHFIALTGPDRIKVEINIDHIVSLRTPREADRVVHKDANCIVFLTDGKFIAVVEDCVQVNALIDDALHEE